MTAVLTKQNQEVIGKLDRKDYEGITQRQITTMLKKVLDYNDSRAKKVSKDVYDFEVYKFPNKTPKQVENYISKKLDKNDKAVFREAISDYTSFPDPGVSKDKARSKAQAKAQAKKVSDDKLYGGLVSTQGGTSQGGTTQGKQTKSSGTSSELDALLDKLLSDEGSEPEGSESTSDPFSGVGRRIGGGEVDKSKNNQTKGKSSGIDFSSIDFSSFFKEGSKVYKENKETIDKLKNALSKENLDSGAWFTEIASMEVPELKVLQQVVNYTPLGFSDKDKDNFAKMLSRDPDQMNSVSTSDALKTVGKMLVNPDEIGVLLKTRAEQISADAQEGLDKWWRKVTGQKPKKDEELGSLEELVNTRRAKIEKDKKRQADLDRLNGKEPEPDKSEKPINWGTRPIGSGVDPVTGIKAGGVVYNNNFDDIPMLDITGQFIGGDKNQMTAEELLRPPPIPGFKESSATQDAFSFLRGLFIPDFSVGTDKQKYLAHLKQTDPSAYNKYQDAMKQYEYTKKKLVLTKDSDIDLSIHKDQVSRTFDFSRELLEKASSLGKLTSDQIETIYDVSGTLEDVMSGDVKISYADLGKFQRAIFSMTQDVLADSNIDDYIAEMRDALGSSFDGDSSLADDYNYIDQLKQKTDTDTKAEVDIDDKKDEDKPDSKPNDPDDPDEDPDPDPDTEESGPIKEVSIDTTSSKPDSKEDWPRLRPRMAWGGTDELFYRRKDEIERANLISESMGMETPGFGNGPDNPLYKCNLIHDSMRYSNCFAMPAPGPPDPLQLPSKFIQMTTPILVSQYAPIGRSFEVARDPYKFGQYQHFKPAYQQTVYPMIEQRVQTGEYPYIADLRTGGQEQDISKWDYLTNLRFTS